MKSLSFIPTKLFMNEAIRLAKEAYSRNEVPVGAVVVYDDVIIGTGRNRREQTNLPMAHAEIEAIYAASKFLKTWKLPECELYVTLEPCPMCMGAILNSRIKRVIFGLEDFRTGCCGSALDMKPMDYYRSPDMFPGFMEEECKKIMKDFFTSLRG